MMKKLVLILISLLLLASVIPMGIGCSDDTVKWTLNTYSNEGETRTEIMRDFAARVEDLSDGKMEIRIAVANEIVDGQGVFTATSRGSQEMGLTSTGALFQPLPKYAFTIAQIWGDNIDERIQYFEEVTKYAPIENELDAANIMPLFWVSSSYLEWYFQDEVTTIAGMAGHSLYSAGGAVTYLIKALSSEAKELDTTAIFQQLEHGFIDGVGVMPFDDFYRIKLYEQLPYVLLTYGLEYPFPVMVNKDAFEGLDEDLQAIVRQAATEVQATGIAMIEDEFEKAKNDLIANPDVTVNELSPDEQIQFKALAEEVFQLGLSQQFTNEQITDILAIVDGVKAELAQ